MHPEVLVLDLDGTLRDLEATDGQVPLATISALIGALKARPRLRLVFNTGQTLAHVLGLLQQVLGRRLVHSGRVAVVYERGAGVYLPGAESTHKLQLFAELDWRLLRTFDRIRARIFQDCSSELGWGCLDYHVPGSEFNVAIKPNAPEGSAAAKAITHVAAPFLVRLLARAASEETGLASTALEAALLAHLRAQNPRTVGVLPEPPEGLPEVPDWLRVSMFYFPGDMTGLSATDLSKVNGLRAVLRSWGLENPPTLALGDGAEDLELLREVAAWTDSRIACPENARRDVLELVRSTAGAVYPVGRAEGALEWSGLLQG